MHTPPPSYHPRPVTEPTPFPNQIPSYPLNPIPSPSRLPKVNQVGFQAVPCPKVQEGAWDAPTPSSPSPARCPLPAARYVLQIQPRSTVFFLSCMEYMQLSRVLIHTFVRVHIHVHYYTYLGVSLSLLA